MFHAGLLWTRLKSPQEGLTFTQVSLKWFIPWACVLTLPTWLVLEENSINSTKQTAWHLMLIFTDFYGGTISPFKRFLVKDNFLDRLVKSRILFVWHFSIIKAKKHDTLNVWFYKNYVKFTIQIPIFVQAKLRPLSLRMDRAYFEQFQPFNYCVGKFVMERQFNAD